ncbi:MAG: four helix bundle protein [Candidatus Blackburnbacteria bacterium]|nr:four helix bundle protein [Candidatus Blackburnbacteria bacterium]
MENTAIEILELLIKGNREPEQRALLLNQADVKLELLKVLLKMAAETRALNLKTAGILSAGLEEIGRMLGGWIRATKQSAS